MSIWKSSATGEKAVPMHSCVLLLFHMVFTVSSFCLFSNNLLGQEESRQIVERVLENPVTHEVFVWLRVFVSLLH